MSRIGFDRPLPHNPDLERSLIGAILCQGPDCVPKVAAALKPHGPLAIFNHAMRNVYETILRLHAEGKPIDGAFIRRDMELRGVWKNYDDLVLASATVASGSRVLEYAAAVKDDHDRRIAINQAHRLAESAYAGRPLEMPTNGNGSHPPTNGDLIRSPIVLRASDVNEQPLSWLWQGRIESGELNIFCGPPGVSKSMLTTNLAATVSLGAPWPEPGQSSREPGAVVMMSAEDSYSKTIRPRLRAAGANAGNVFILDAVQVGAERQPITLLSDLDMIRQTCLDAHAACGFRVKLLIIDPVNSFIGTKLDSNKNEDVRAAIEPLSLLAAELDMAVIIVMHTNKALAMNALDKVAGSRAFTGKPRTVSFIGRQQDSAGVNIWAVGKINNEAMPKPLAYTIRATGIDQPPRIEWLADYDTAGVDAMDLIGARQSTGRKSSVPDAKQWLSDMLPSDGSQVPAADILDEGQQSGFSKRILFEAAKELGVKKSRVGKGWGWSK